MVVVQANDLHDGGNITKRGDFVNSTFKGWTKEKVNVGLYRGYTQPDIPFLLMTRSMLR